MQEVMAVIRMNMIEKTKKALSDSGFYAFHCRKVLGRGKGQVDFRLVANLVENIEELPSKEITQFLSESHRLVPKRMLSIIVEDDEVKKVVDIIIAVNQTKNPGDGKIFISQIDENIRINTGNI